MKTIYLVIIFICFFVGCKSIEKDDTGLIKTKREEPQAKFDGKRDIIEYHRNGKLILEIIKYYQKDSDHIWQTKQIVYYNDKKVLEITDNDFSLANAGTEKLRKQMSEKKNCTFSGLGDSNVDLNVLFDKNKGTIKGVGIYNSKTFFIYDSFKLKNGLMVPCSDLELKKSNKAIEAVTDVFSDLPKAIKTQKFDKDKLKDKLIKHKKEIENMK